MNDNGAFELAVLMYANEPCRICGETITREDVMTCVFAGYSVNNEARSAHKQCWDAFPATDNVPRPEWVYQ